jgi:hypothetical protein
MKRVADREIAERALKALRSLNTSARNHTLAELDALRLQIAPTTPDHERADAWLAVCAFCEAVKPGSETTDATSLHRIAIAKTEVWLKSFD